MHIDITIIIIIVSPGWRSQEMISELVALKKRIAEFEKGGGGRLVTYLCALSGNIIVSSTSFNIFLNAAF